MSMQQEQTRPRRLVQSYESVASLAKRNGSPCQQGDDYQGVKTMRNPWAFLPEIINTPIAPLRFLHLKHLTVFLHTVPRVVSPTYDYLSLAYFLDASPALETFTLKVSQTRMEHDVISEDSSHLRQMPGHHHDTIKNVKIMIGYLFTKLVVVAAYIALWSWKPKTRSWLSRDTSSGKSPLQ
ncbi:hypothetical protein DAI22_05g239900 [Oryza sativa Japonica Group]|nr:hypothetical protein DAI22_05g239900 [Oryza sativa Japonica Group]